MKRPYKDILMQLNTWFDSWKVLLIEHSSTFIAVGQLFWTPCFCFFATHRKFSKLWVLNRRHNWDSHRYFLTFTQQRDPDSANLHHGTCRPNPNPNVTSAGSPSKSDHLILVTHRCVARWPSGLDAGLAINGSRVRILASQSPLSSATLGKLLTHMCFCHQAV